MPRYNYREYTIHIPSNVAEYIKARAKEAGVTEQKLIEGWLILRVAAGQEQEALKS